MNLKRWCNRFRNDNRERQKRNIRLTTVKPRSVCMRSLFMDPSRAGKVVPNFDHVAITTPPQRQGRQPITRDGPNRAAGCPIRATTGLRTPHAARPHPAPRTPMQHGRSLKAECANGLRFSRHNARQIMTFTVDARSTPRSRRLHDPFENMSIVHPHHLRTGGPTPPTRALPMFEPGIERGPRE